jgi:hypothetical protein
MNRRNKQAFAQFLITCTCGVSKIKRKNCWWRWGLQGGDCLWQEMSKQHGEWRNSWLSPSWIPVCWLTQTCRCHCWFWIGVYAKPLRPGNKCATRIPRWRSILQHPPIRAPPGARAYPWILRKYCPCVHASVCVSVPLQISVGCVYCV